MRTCIDIVIDTLTDNSVLISTIAALGTIVWWLAKPLFKLLHAPHFLHLTSSVSVCKYRGPAMNFNSIKITLHISNRGDNAIHLRRARADYVSQFQPVCENIEKIVDGHSALAVPISILAPENQPMILVNLTVEALDGRAGKLTLRELFRLNCEMRETLRSNAGDRTTIAQAMKIAYRLIQFRLRPRN